MGCPRLCAGDFRDEVNVETPDRQPDGCGGFTNDTWAAHATVPTIFAKIEDKSGQERWTKGRLVTVSYVDFYTYWEADIAETDRLSFGGKTYNIRHIENIDNLDQWMKIRTDEGVVD